jgi:hypothetical protein
MLPPNISISFFSLQLDTSCEVKVLCYWPTKRIRLSVVQQHDQDDQRDRYS